MTCGLETPIAARMTEGRGIDLVRPSDIRRFDGISDTLDATVQFQKGRPIDSPVEKAGRAMCVMQRGHLSNRGAATKTRLIEAAADLMLLQGVAATTLDEIRVRSGTSKSQLYWHFPDKRALVLEVAKYRVRQVLDRERMQLAGLRSVNGLEQWKDHVVARCGVPGGVYGCVLGSMASELSEQDEHVRDVLEHAFAAWRDLISEGLAHMRAAGALRAEVDPDRLAMFLIAALQGGHVLAQVQQDTSPMDQALAEAIDHVKSYGLAAPASA